MLQFNFAKSFAQDKNNNKRVRVNVVDRNEPFQLDPWDEKARPDNPRSIDFMNKLGIMYWHSDRLSQNQVSEMIDPYYIQVVDAIAKGYNGYVYRKLIKDDKVVTALTRKIASEHSNNREDFYTIVTINTLLFEEMSSLDLNNLAMLDLYKKLGYEANRVIISKIMDINSRGYNSESISKDNASMLAIARFSEIKGDVTYSVSRVNYTMKSMANCTKIFIEDVLIDLYRILIDSMSALVSGTLLRLGFDFNKTDESVKMEQMQIKTVLDILEAQTYNMIEYSLKEFTNRFNYKQDQVANFDKISFLRNTSPEDYPNIWRVINKLNTEGYLVH